MCVFQDQKRAEKLSKRVNAIQDVNESVSLLTQLLEVYDRTTNPQSNAELIQVCGTFTQATPCYDKPETTPTVP